MSMDQFIAANDSRCGKEFSDWYQSRLELWNSFCQAYRVAEDSVPLFELRVRRTPVCSDQRSRQITASQSASQECGNGGPDAQGG